MTIRAVFILVLSIATLRLGYAQSINTAEVAPKSGPQLVVSTSFFNGLYSLFPTIEGTVPDGMDFPHQRLNFGLGIQYPPGFGLLLEAGNSYKRFIDHRSITASYTRYLHGTIHYQFPVVPQVTVGPYLGVYYGVREMTAQIQVSGSYYPDYTESIRFLPQRRWQGGLGFELHYQPKPRIHLAFRNSMLGIGKTSDGPTRPRYFGGLGYPLDPLLIYLDLHLRYHFF